ncbi:protein-L-isoaspartate carboxylmethyltransferase [Halovivax ruber XH-70]|uniref:protein-L-isoaspartate(D-aspartate) O-methyltransferase n=1 Tax=Halovivax ruber (strain DSM 18193 / JCM 13892 / XH-70) TaxID=797302 RepID=L0IA18_HALRX|nr:protein-L-isoaspartate O-methyltransferase [Halovivax ruber]AGB15091.1 protein-L-isoaspartate carboxylmethyltransferase [Halovivax ruber XH-70]
MDRAVLREDMIDSLQHEPKDVLADEAVAVAMSDVPRHEFLPASADAYADRSYECEGTRALSPSEAARLVQGLDPAPGDSVLVVGVGVGYTAALLAELVGEEHVHAVDISRPIVSLARSNLASAGYGGVLVDRRDGSYGLPEYAPFDRILLEAAAVDAPMALTEQLADGGRLVYPRGATSQRLVAVTDDGRTDLGPVSFAPILVEGEQSGALERNRTAREDLEHAVRRTERRRGWELDWIDWE